MMAIFIFDANFFYSVIKLHQSTGKVARGQMCESGHLQEQLETVA